MAENNALWNWGNQQTYHEKIKQEIEKASTGGITIDSELDVNSENLIQNKAVAEALAERAINKVLTTLDEVNNPDLESGIYSVESVAMSFPCGTRSYYVLIANRHRKGSGYGSQIGIPYTDGNMVGVYYRNCKTGTWQDWQNVADGGNADTVDEKHSYDFVNYYNTVLTDTDMLNNANWTGAPYEGVVNSTVATAMGLASKWWHIKFLRHVDGNGYGTQIAFPINNANTLTPMYRSATGTTWGDWKAFRDGGNANTVNTQTLSAPTTAFTAFYPCFVDSDNNVVAAENVKTNAAYRFQMKSGTADAEGTAQLMLGNQILSGTEGNMRGQVVFFNNANAYYAILMQNTSQTNNVTHILPASGGTLALNTVATASANGLMSTGTQTFAGAKTFNGIVKVAGATAAGTSQVRNIAAGTAEATTTNCPNGALYGQYS